MGLRTYGMLCPLLPGVADAPEQIDDLVRFVKGCGAEEVFSEAVNARGNSLTLTERVLRENGFPAEAEAISAIRKRKAWSSYAVNLVRKIQAAMRRHMATEGAAAIALPRWTDRAGSSDDPAGRCGCDLVVGVHHSQRIRGQSMKRIFTAKFFRLSAHDQAAVVEAELRDIEQEYGRYASREDGRRARRQAARIRRKAVAHGILKG